MSIRKFKCTVRREDEYIIEIDDSIITEEWMENFREYMNDFDSLEEHAEHLAQYQARMGNHQFIEGYGNVKRDGECWFLNDDEKPAEGFNIIREDEDNYCEVDLQEQ